MEISSRRSFSMPQPLQARRSLQARRPGRFKRGGRHIIKRGSGRREVFGRTCCSAATSDGFRVRESATALV
jgi:hypothetical protein